MNLTLPFSQALGKNSGLAGDGVIHGMLPKVAVIALRSHLNEVVTNILRGDKNNGDLVYSDVSAAASDGTPDDVSFFDSSSPNDDELLINVNGHASVSAIQFLVTTQGVGTGNWTIGVEYWDKTQEQYVSASNISDNSSGFKDIMGLVRISFDPINPASNIAVLPVMGINGRWLRFKVSGVTTVTTPPRFGRIFCEHTSADYSDESFLVAQDANPNFSTAPSEVLPAVGDVRWFMLSRKFTKLIASMYRAADNSYTVENVYWNGSAIVPLAGVDDPSAGLKTALENTSMTVWQISMASTANWDDNTARSGEALSGDGYLEFKVGPNPEARMALGLDEDTSGPSYRSLRYGVVVGMNDQSVVQVYEDGVPLGVARAVVTGDVIRIHRVGAAVQYLLNGAVWRTSIKTSDNDLYVKISGSQDAPQVDELGLYNKEIGDVLYPIAITWSLTGITTTISSDIQVPKITNHLIGFSPPADWAQSIIIDENNVQHVGYPFGIRVTSQGLQLVAPPLFTLRALPIEGAGIDGITIPAGTTGSTILGIIMLARSGGANTDSAFLLVNTTTGNTIPLVWPAGHYAVSVDCNFVVNGGDVLVLVQIGEDGTQELSDGAFILMD